MALRVRWARWIHLTIILCLLFSSHCQADDDDESTKREPAKLISLVESISKTQKSLKDPTVEEIRKQYWQKALADIRNMSFGFSGTRVGGNSKSPLGQQWKWGVETSPLVTGAPGNETSTDAPLSDGVKRRRFEGFMSWERMLQEWADDVQEYFDQVERESSGQDYALGNYGRASNTNATATWEKQAESIHDSGMIQGVGNETLDGPILPLEEEPVAAATANQESTERSAKTPPLPVPAPVQPGGAVLPHTDLSDLSKRVEIVTTASLPWRTGTSGRVLCSFQMKRQPFRFASHDYTYVLQVPLSIPYFGLPILLMVVLKPEVALLSCCLGWNEKVTRRKFTVNHRPLNRRWNRKPTFENGCEGQQTCPRRLTIYGSDGTRLGRIQLRTQSTAWVILQLSSLPKRLTFVFWKNPNI